MSCCRLRPKPGLNRGDRWSLDCGQHRQFLPGACQCTLLPVLDKLSRELSAVESGRRSVGQGPARQPESSGRLGSCSTNSHFSQRLSSLPPVLAQDYRYNPRLLWRQVSVPPQRETVNPVRPGREQRQQWNRVPGCGWYRLPPSFPDNLLPR